MKLQETITALIISAFIGIAPLQSNAETTQPRRVADIDEFWEDPCGGPVVIEKIPMS